MGRSAAVEGSLEIEGLEIVATSIAADLTEPITFDEEPLEGEVVTVEAEGDLTLHGATRSVTILLEARWDDGRIAVVGSLDVEFADFDITPPSIGPATVEDHGTIELQLVFEPSA